MEGFSATGDYATARFLGEFIAGSFRATCQRALDEHDMNLSHWNSDTNTYWGCGLFDNETDARRTFG